MEPTLAWDDIQGHIFPGFGSQSSAVIGLRLTAPERGRETMRLLLPFLTRMSEGQEAKADRRAAFTRSQPAPEQSTTFLSVSFSASTFRAWGEDLKNFDPSFVSGMKSDAGDLRDPVDEDDNPIDWQFGVNEDNQLDALLVLGNSSSDFLKADMARWLELLSLAWTVVFEDYGARRDGDKEFFGFHDGVSQPALRGIAPDGTFVSRRIIDPSDERHGYFAKPGQQLVWPGQFIFGYPVETTSPLQMGATRMPPAPWMQNGSYLVFRRLLQKTKLFSDAVSQLETFLRGEGEQVADGWVASRLVGRWPDGTPLTASPDSPDPDVAGSENRINNFMYSRSVTPTKVIDPSGAEETLPSVEGDIFGNKCPFSSHIRKVNPRDGTSEIGSEHHAGKLVLRRGIAFEGKKPDDDRGLLFLCYQTSIQDQFRFLQINWANSAQRPTSNGIDPIIGQDGTPETKRRLLLDAPSGRQLTCPFNGRWVVATGGEYFVTPGLDGMKMLLEKGAD